MSKVGIIGDSDSILGFLALGIDLYPAYEADDIKKTIHRLAQRDYAIIYITEDASILAGESVSRYKDLPLPAVIIIPGSSGSKGIGMNEVRESAKRAIGADILFSEE